MSSSPVERVDVHPYTSSSSPPSHTLPTIPIPVLPTTLTPRRNLHHQTPNPPPPPTTTVIPVRGVSDCAPPTINGGGESRETEGAGETERGGETESAGETEEERGEEEMEEEPIVSERNEIQNQTSSTIQQVHSVLVYPSPYP